VVFTRVRKEDSYCIRIHRPPFCAGHAS
jgi:hypothetical protein